MAKYGHLLILIIFIFTSCTSEKTETPKASQKVQKTVEEQPQPKSNQPTAGNTEAPPSKIEMNINLTGTVSDGHAPSIASAEFITSFENGKAGLKVKAVLKKPDELVSFKYEWQVNSNPVSNSSDTISGLKRGDKVSVKITPSKGSETGQFKTIVTEIRNSPPVVQPHNEISQNGDVFTYQVKANDPDGDTLTFKLAQQLPDVKIDEKTGLVTWRPKPDYKGQFLIQIVIDDGHGGTVNYTLNAAQK